MAAGMENNLRSGTGWESRTVTQVTVDSIAP